MPGIHLAAGSNAAGKLDPATSVRMTVNYLILLFDMRKYEIVLHQKNECASGDGFASSHPLLLWCEVTRQPAVP
jgi:hypothetical protein